MSRDGHENGPHKLPTAGSVAAQGPQAAAGFDTHWNSSLLWHQATLPTSCSQAMTKHSKQSKTGSFLGEMGLLQWVTLAQGLPQSLARRSLELPLDCSWSRVLPGKLSFLFPSLRSDLLWWLYQPLSASSHFPRHSSLASAFWRTKTIAWVMLEKPYSWSLVSQAHVCLQDGGRNMKGVRIRDHYETIQGTLLFFFQPHYVADGILVARPGFKPSTAHLYLECNLKPWTTRKVTRISFK